MKVLTVKEVQELLGISASSTYRLLKNPDCPTMKIGGSYRIIENDLLDFLKNNNKKERN